MKNVQRISLYNAQNQEVKGKMVVRSGDKKTSFIKIAGTVVMEWCYTKSGTYLLKGGQFVEEPIGNIAKFASVLGFDTSPIYEARQKTRYPISDDEGLELQSNPRSNPDLW